MTILKQKFRNLSIRVKLLIIVLSTVFVALIIATSAVGFLNYYSTSKNFSEQLNVLLDITKERSIVALTFRDSRAINNNLQTLSRLESIQNACIYDAKSKLFGQYKRHQTNTCQPSFELTENHDTLNETIKVSGAIEHNNKVLGHLVIYASTNELTNRLWQFALYSCLVILASAFIAYLMSSAMQRSVTLPIIRLSKLAKTIGETADFSLRAKVHNEDEAGALATAFNNLIGNIQESQMQMHEMVLELQAKTQQLESHSELVEGRNRAIRHMFEGASHDLRQPLQAMALFVDALNGMSNADQREILHKLELAIRNMRNLFDDLLDVSKLESRLGHVERASVNLKPLLESVFHEFDMMAADKDLTLRMHMEDIIVDSNASMLERIIRNLLSNAIRYTSTGGILLANRKRGDDIWIEVWDTGRGIPAEAQSNIFKQFYQVENKSKEGQQGFGLGLSIVKRLAELLGHKIEIFSREDRGTLFRIHVPRANKSTVDVSTTASLPQLSPAMTSERAEISPSELPGSAANILLVDDDTLVRDSLNTLMQSWGMKVWSFASISDMAQFLRTEPLPDFDMMVSDFHLSETETGIDAIALAQSMLRPDAKDKLPALIVTGGTDPEIDEMLKVAAIRKLSKPVKAAKLRALMNHLMK